MHGILVINIDNSLHYIFDDFKHGMRKPILAPVNNTVITFAKTISHNFSMNSFSCFSASFQSVSIPSF